jgi:hypothetical protein
VYGKFKKGKTLTTQVVRKSNFKKRRSASSRVPQSELSEGQGKNIRRRRRYNHEYTTKLLINEREISIFSTLFLLLHHFS